MTSSALAASLSTTTLGRSLHILEETPSTNTAALALAQNGAADGSVVVAEVQTAGRGRLGRHWFSPPGKNLYASVVLRRTPVSEQAVQWLNWVPLVSALAVGRAIQVMTGLQPSLKWPNDILLGERKVGGLLCESSGLGTLGSFVIVGIGLNVNVWREAFPEDLRDRATSLAAETGHPFDRVAVLAMILSELELRYDAFFSGRFADIAHEYDLRCSTVGQHVRVDMARGTYIEGLAESIAADGSLRVRVQDSTVVSERGTVIDVRCGDITHLRSLQPSLRGT